MKSFEKALLYSYTDNPMFQELVDLVGLGDAYLIVQIFGGLNLKIPSMQEVSQNYNDYLIVRDYLSSGKKASLIAQKHGISVGRLTAITFRYKKQQKRRKSES